MEKLLTLSQVAELLAVSKPTARRFLRENGVEALCVGGGKRHHCRYRKNAIFGAIERGMSKATAPRRKSQKIENLAVSCMGIDELYALTKASALQ